jgi:hypothetical protein
MRLKKISSSKILLLAMACLTLGALLSGCSGERALAAESVETFFQAILEKDETLFRSAVCSEYETIAMMDFASFAIVETRMENFSCQVEGEAEGPVSVRCQGNLQASFGDETRSFDLSSRVYQVIEENGQWLVCGHLDEM